MSFSISATVVRPFVSLTNSRGAKVPIPYSGFLIVLISAKAMAAAVGVRYQNGSPDINNSKKHKYSN